MAFFHHSTSEEKVVNAVVAALEALTTLFTKIGALVDEATSEEAKRNAVRRERK